MFIKALAALAFTGVVVATSMASAGTAPQLTKTFLNVRLAVTPDSTPTSLANGFCVDQGLIGSTSHRLGLQLPGGLRPGLLFASITCALIPL
jgi:hypothetical protein